MRILLKILSRFIAILASIWLLIELTGFFFREGWGEDIRTWNNGLSFWILVGVSAVLAILSIVFAETEFRRRSKDGLISTAPTTRHQRALPWITQKQFGGTENEQVASKEASSSQVQVGGKKNKQRIR